MSHTPNIRLSTPLRPDFNLIGVHKDDDVTLPFDLSDHPSWKDEGYNLTIYKKSDRSTIVSASFDKDEFSVVINDYGFGNIQAVIVIEDRTDPSNIDAIETIGYIIFKEFPGGVELTQIGTLNYLNANDTNTAIPYYESGLKVS